MQVGWRNAWNQISYRIQGIGKAASFLIASLSATEGDAYDAGHTFVLTNALGVISALEEYSRAFVADLPQTAAAALARFLSEIEAMHTGLPPSGLAGLQGTVTALTSFDAEFNHHLFDHENIARRLAERAFLHLQRTIIADQEMSAKWRTAFAAGETACEKLGAAHLLYHGIWAFKANAEGARTDLVLGTPLSLTSHVRDSAEALILTEWKLVRSASEAERQAAQARAQMSQYSGGVLAGLELASVRYAVLVSLDAIEVPADVPANNMIYRHVNIAAAPSVPSRSTVFRHEAEV